MTLRRRHPDVRDEEFASFVAAVRASVPSTPHEETAQRHLAAMRAAAEDGVQTVGTAASGPVPERNHGAGAELDRVGRRRSAGPLRLRPAARLGAALVGAVVAFGGTSTVLAAVGVELPDAVRAPFDAVGIDLPNQPGDGEDGSAPPAGDKRRDPGASPEHRRDGENRPSERGERGRSEQKRQDGDKRRDRSGRGRSGEAPGKRSGEAKSRTGQPPGSRRDEAPGRRDGSSRGNGGGSRGNAGGRTKSRPANPAPKRSSKRGAGPARPVKPNPPRDRAREKPAKPVPPPEPEPTTTVPPTTTEASP
ncbi:MAG TPA: hypothetical protein VF529_05835 [Solirubrobacteraceae bacterium]|jgi:hypothetical protein